MEDKGIGISSEDLPYIFEKGYVGKILRKGDYHSTGMGLAFAKKHCTAALHFHRGFVQGRGGNLFFAVFSGYLRPFATALSSKKRISTKMKVWKGKCAGMKRIFRILSAKIKADREVIEHE